ncbi:protein-L-isoaspartate(D-aspartate) O-methyltransferase [Thermopolyspora flexuosa]|uniref:Protein-L-isoaspartate O-methyltransferase n=1 Tax=Thermopolyspora flexuosa TaxID=103836 RepID=A0A543J021_9ACTN|nr:protein-L-isoaspartate(D-aspartate) O-methyltransferase [Thermopolyspora flexuosa]
MPETAIIDDAVARAVAAVPREHYTDHPHLGGVPQATAQFAIERDLRRAGVRPGMRVLEIGTGTGYTGALLTELVGDDGHVVSVDIDPALVKRAAKLHAERGVANLTLLVGDGHLGAPDHAPFDAILGWATPTHIPHAWIRQARPGAIISTPIYLAPVARTVGHIRARVTGDGRLTEPQLGGAVYVDMGPKVNTSLGIPMFYLDARHDSPDGRIAWVSVAWRGHHPGHDPVTTLRMLMNPAHAEPVALGDSDEEQAIAWRDFRAYCAGRDNTHTPSSLTAYGTAGDVWISGIGFSSGKHAAVLTADGRFLANRSDSPALAKLRDHFRDWQLAGRPGIDALQPRLIPISDGWQVRVTLAHATR